LGEYMLLSSEQIATFSDIYSGNNREVQALNDRTIFYDESYGN
jgi:carbonic anhydrase